MSDRSCAAAVPDGGDTPEVTVIRSARRTRTVQARWVSGKIVVRIPARMSAQEEREVVADMVARLRARSVASVGDAELASRAAALNADYLEGRARAGSVSWSARQATRWGSCTTATGAIRISDRLREVPGYVLDAVLIHELVHTFIPGGHTAEFWSWANRAPQAERARGYLEAYQRWGTGSR